MGHSVLHNTSSHIHNIYLTGNGSAYARHEKLWDSGLRMFCITSNRVARLHMELQARSITASRIAACIALIG